MTGISWPSGVPILSDGHVTLRAWDAADAAVVHEACQDPEAQRWVAIPTPYQLTDAETYVGDRARHQWETRAGTPFAITDTRTGAVIGGCGLSGVDDDALTAHVGYWVAPWARGAGLAQRAVTLLLDWAVADLGLARIEAYVEIGNAASRGVAEAVGCVPDGLLPAHRAIHGTRRDDIRYVYTPAPDVLAPAEDPVLHDDQAQPA